jgi:hypothetical protein
MVTESSLASVRGWPAGLIAWAFQAPSTAASSPAPRFGFRPASGASGRVSATTITRPDLVGDVHAGAENGASVG